MANKKRSALPANKQRGEVVFPLNGTDYVLKANLGALAQIEEALGLDTLLELDGRLARIRSKDVMSLLRCLSAAGGNQIPDEELEEILPADIEAAVDIIADAMNRGAPPAKKQTADNRKTRRAAASGAGKPSKD